MDVPPAVAGREAQRSSTLAWIALPLAFSWILPLGLFIGTVDAVLGLVCSAVGAGLAVVVLLRSRHGVDHGRTLAWISLASTAAHLALAPSLLFVTSVEGIAPETMEDAELPVHPGSSVTGDCLLSVERPLRTSCVEPHRVEVAGTYFLPDKGSFDDAEAEAQPLCSTAVATYLDIPEDEAAGRFGFSISGDEPYRVACWAVSDDAISGTMRAARP